MEITIDKLLKGKPTIIKSKDYLSTSEYVSPFIDKMSKFTDNFIIKVQTPNQITTSNGEEDITFNRVWIQAILPEKYCIENHDEVYGLVYGLDVRNPVYKVYRGMLNKAYINLCVFDPQWQQVQELKPQENFVINITELMEKVSDFEQKIKHMKSTFLSSELSSKHELLGKMIEKSMLEEYVNIGGKVKISPTTVVKAYENVYHNTSSSYYVGDKQESTIFNFHNAFTEIIKDDGKDIMNKFEKTILINSLFNI